MDLWTESSKYEFKHFLITKSLISGLWVFDWISGYLDTRIPGYLDTWIPGYLIPDTWWGTHTCIRYQVSRPWMQKVSYFSAKMQKLHSNVYFTMCF